MIALTAAGCETPRLDAEVLLAARARRRPRGADRATRGASSTGAQARVQDVVAAAAASASRSRTSSGAKGFRRLELQVDPRVLVPRPETELLVEAALDAAARARAWSTSARARRGRAGAQGRAARPRGARRPTSATTRSPSRARTPRVWGSTSTFVAGRSARGRRGRRGRLEPAVRARRARDAAARDRAPRAARSRCSRGADGLDVIRRLVRDGAARAFLALEVGEGQADAVDGAGRRRLRDVERVRDLAGIERVVVGRRAGDGRRGTRGAARRARVLTTSASARRCIARRRRGVPRRHGLRARVRARQRARRSRSSTRSRAARRRSPRR